MLLDCLPTGQTSCRYTGVINFLAYEVSVLAQAGDLTSAEARVGVAMPRPLPSGPRNFRIVSGGSTTVTLAWDPPTDVDLALPVQGYQVTLLLQAMNGAPDMVAGADTTRNTHPLLQISMYQEFPTIPATYSYPLITTVPNTKRSVQLTGLIPGLRFEMIRLDRSLTCVIPRLDAYVRSCGPLPHVPSRYQFGVQAFTAAGPGGMTGGVGRWSVHLPAMLSYMGL